MVKATALSSTEITDGAFKPLTFGKVPHLQETRFRIVSVLKGEMVDADIIRYRHYARPERDSVPTSKLWSPAHNFISGRSYLLWATRNDDHYQQILLKPSDSEFATPIFQTPVLMPDDKPVKGDVKDIVWAALNQLLRSNSPFDVVTAIHRLGSMSDSLSYTYQGNWVMGDFTVKDAVDAVAPLIGAPDPTIARAALDVASLAPKRVETFLLAASRIGPVPFRAATLDTLVPVKTPAVQARAREAVNDKAPEVAAAALRWLASFGGDETRDLTTQGTAMMSLKRFVRLSNRTSRLWRPAPSKPHHLTLRALPLHCRARVIRPQRACAWPR